MGLVKMSLVRVSSRACKIFNVGTALALSEYIEHMM
jgi:hypothetical protein